MRYKSDFFLTLSKKYLTFFMNFLTLCVCKMTSLVVHIVEKFVEHLKENFRKSDSVFIYSCGFFIFNRLNSQIGGSLLFFRNYKKSMFREFRNFSFVFYEFLNVVCWQKLLPEKLPEKYFFSHLS